MTTRFFIFLVLLLGLNSCDENEVAQTAPPQYATTILPKMATKTKENNDIKNIRLMFAGDIMSQLPQIESADMGSGRYDYTQCFQYIRPIFAQADLVFGNLECTLVDEPPYTGYPNFKSPDQLAEAAPGR